MSDTQQRLDICEIGHRLWRMGHTPANAGNISIRLPGDRILFTPTGVSKGSLKPEDLVILTLAGETIGAGQASSEAPMHLTIYRNRPEVGGVVHVHPPYASGFAASKRALPCDLLAESVCILGEVPVADVAPPGTPQVAEAILPYVHDRVAILLRNHGAVTMGRDVWEAYYRMEIVEHTAQVAAIAMQLGDNPIPSELVRQLRAEYGV